MIIKGSMGTGKTHLCSYLSLKCLKKGFDIITNIKFTAETLDSWPGRLFYITGFKSFFKAYTQTSNKIIVLWDDAQGTAISSLSTTGKKGRAILELIIFIRKFNVKGLIYVAHLSYLPKAITEMSPIFIYKTELESFWISRENIKYSELRARAIKFGFKNKEFLAFKTEGFPDFKNDMNLKDLWNYLATVQGDLKKAVKKYLENPQGANKEDYINNITWEDMIKAIMIKRGFTDIKEFSKMKIYDLFPSRLLYHDNKKK